MIKNPWYTLAQCNDPIQQGDFINQCPVSIPSSGYGPDEDVDTVIEEYKVVVMSQSCDLVNEKLHLVLVCPHYFLEDFAAIHESFKSKKIKEKLRRGDLPGYHLLNKYEVDGIETDFIVVDFYSVYSVPYTLIRDLAQSSGKRLRLIPPYREHLSQAFARFFMRVGLPVDIPKFV
jgi:hypothetical protein